MVILFVLVALVVIAAAFMLAAGRFGGLPDVDQDRSPDRLPLDGPLAPADVDGVRFEVTLRGYRMDEVDQFLDRMQAELAERDRTIAILRGEIVEEVVVEDEIVVSDDGLDSSASPDAVTHES